MIMTDMAVNKNGLWEEGQLSAKLEEINKNHRNHFDGEAVCGMDKQEKFFHYILLIFLLRQSGVSYIQSVKEYPNP